MEALNRRKLVLGLAVTAAVILFVLLILKLFTATISIKTNNPNAKIFVKQGSGEFSEIGVGEAKYKTRSSAVVFVEARLSDQVSQKSVAPKRLRNTRVSLELEQLAAAKFIATAPLLYPHIENGFVYGINPHTNGFEAQPIENNNAVPPVLPQLPFLKRIVWFDAQNYIYATQGRGVGVISSDLGKQISHQSLSYSDAVAANRDAVVLLAADGVYLAKSIDIEQTTKIASTVEHSEPNLTADDEFIYFSSLIFETGTEEDQQPPAKETKLEVFNLNGQKAHEFTLPFKEKVYKVAAVDETTLALLSPAGLTLLDIKSGQTRNEVFSFGEVQDMLIFNGRLLLLGAAGLWEYDKTGSEYHKIATYPAGEEYVKNSLVVIGNELYFSTSAKEEELLKQSTSAKSAIYQLPLR